MSARLQSLAKSFYSVQKQKWVKKNCDTVPLIKHTMLPDLQLTRRIFVGDRKNPWVPNKRQSSYKNMQVKFTI